jgi:uncharacterized membrane protein YfhO
MDNLVQGWNILEGLIVVIITFLLTQWDIKGKWAPIGTALKALLTLLIAFLVAVIEGLWLQTFTWHTIWANLPGIVGWAMGIYGLIVKPGDKLLKAKKTAKTTI